MKVEEKLPGSDLVKLPICENNLILSLFGLMLGYFLLSPEHIIELRLVFMKCSYCKIDNRSFVVSLAKDFDLTFRLVVAVANDLD